ncbi:hypothetical protein E2320_014304 [Naja naja]|nr:hypothetical protein E2320_014304 [Naja naja]
MEAQGSPLQAGSGLPEGPRSSEVERWRFRSCGAREAEGPRALCSRLHRLCRGWLRPERSSKAEMLDLVVLEQLLALLPPELSGWLRECGAESCAQAVALAEGWLLGPAAAPEPGKGPQQGQKGKRKGKDGKREQSEFDLGECVRSQSTGKDYVTKHKASLCNH